MSEGGVKGDCERRVTIHVQERRFLAVVCYVKVEVFVIKHHFDVGNPVIISVSLA